MSVSRPATKERVTRVRSGWTMLSVCLGVVVIPIILVAASGEENGRYTVPIMILSFLSLPLLLAGFFSLQPNEARVIILFGEYKGTVRESGFHWGNPFYSNGSPSSHQPHVSAQQRHAKDATSPPRRGPRRNKISLRARTLNGEKLKVNDRGGNPIEIGAVVVWRVHDTAHAMFDVDDYENYVQMQSESALRHLASQYSYDGGEGEEITLRGHVEEVSLALGTELEDRLQKAGVVVDEARLTHLAYAPEIAQVMLRRQQAEAVIAARGKIVHGAVSMVHMALQELAEKGVVNLDDERRAAMVSNLMVVLCGESEVHPVVNAGTLYN
jgi:regulator of protease activity HflC (stomatin/prohibitin superfamily)